MKNLFILLAAIYFECSRIEKYNDNFPILINVVINVHDWNSQRKINLFNFFKCYNNSFK